MRRVGLVLVGLGACLIVFALLIPTWVSGRVIKFPLNQYASVNLTDSNASYFSPAKLAEQTGVTVEATQTIKGNAAAGSSSTAVWNQFTYIYDQTNKLPIQQTSRTIDDGRTASSDEAWTDALGARVAEVSADVTVELGSARMPVSRLLELAVGDLVTLDAGREGPVIVRVAGKPRFYGAPGIRNGNNAVRVDDRL